MEAYEFEGGHITISHCDEFLSIGTLTLEPGAELERHTRPVAEELLQVQGTGNLVVYPGDGREREVKLQAGDVYTIPADEAHKHVNPGETTSTVLWRFEGDIRGVIRDIREDLDEM